MRIATSFLAIKSLFNSLSREMMENEIHIFNRIILKYIINSDYKWMSAYRLLGFELSCYDDDLVSGA